MQARKVKKYELAIQQAELSFHEKEFSAAKRSYSKALSLITSKGIVTSDARLQEREIYCELSMLACQFKLGERYLDEGLKSRLEVLQSKLFSLLDSSENNTLLINDLKEIDRMFALFENPKEVADSQYYYAKFVLKYSDDQKRLENAKKVAKQAKKSYKNLGELYEAKSDAKAAHTLKRQINRQLNKAEQLDSQSPTPLRKMGTLDSISATACKRKPKRGREEDEATKASNPPPRIKPDEEPTTKKFRPSSALKRKHNSAAPFSTSPVILFPLPQQPISQPVCQPQSPEANIFIKTIETFLASITKIQSFHLSRVLREIARCHFNEIRENFLNHLPILTPIFDLFDKAAIVDPLNVNTRKDRNFMLESSLGMCAYIAECNEFDFSYQDTKSEPKRSEENKAQYSQQGSVRFFWNAINDYLHKLEKFYPQDFKRIITMILKHLQASEVMYAMHQPNEREKIYNIFDLHIDELSRQEELTFRKSQ